MNTAFRLIVLVPAAILLVCVAVLALGFGGASVASVAVAALLIGAPVALIVWTLRDHSKRRKIGNDLNA